jgi:hypothetical protein
VRDDGYAERLALERRDGRVVTGYRLRSQTGAAEDAAELIAQRGVRHEEATGVIRPKMLFRHAKKRMPK